MILRGFRNVIILAFEVKLNLICERVKYSRIKIYLSSWVPCSINIIKKSYKCKTLIGKNH